MRFPLLVAFTVLLSACSTTFEGICGFRPVQQQDGVIYGPVRCEAKQ